MRDKLPAKKRTGKKLSKKKLVLIVILALVVVLAGVVAAISASAKKAAAASAGVTETVTLKKTNLSQSINVSGVVESAETTNIYSTLGYPVKEIFAKAGDMVEAGDLLAVLDTADLENDIAQAEISCGSAKRNLNDAVTNAKNALAAAKITAEQIQIAVASAEKELAAAKTDAAKPFDSLPYDRAVAEAKTALDRKKAEAITALADHAKALLAFDDYQYQNAITDASIALERKKTERDWAKADLNKAKADYDAARYYKTYSSQEERDAAVEAAKKTFDDAQKAYDNAVNAVDDAQRTLDRAKKDLTRAKDDAVKAASDKLDAANKAQADAQRAYDKALQDRNRAVADNKDSNKKKIASAEKALLDAQKQLESAENSVKNAENALNQAQAKQGSAGSDVELRELTLDKLNRQLAGGQIVAESRGVITAVNAEVGAAPSGALFVIDSKDALYVSARVKEYNLKTLFVGQEIIITTDATGSKKFSATLSYISPKAVSEAGSTSVEFEVRAAFHPTESADFAGTPITDPDEAIKIGMNAFLDIVTDAKENVYAVPVSAIITNEKGSFVYAAPEEPSGGGRKPKQVPEPLEIPVTLGLKTSTSVEISGAGLKDGLQILTDPESKLSNGQPKGGIMGMGV